MGKPGQRFTHPKIIDRPELKSPLRHFAEGSITTALWAIWIYWILPIFTILLWLFGFRLFYRIFFIEGRLSELIAILKNGGAAILIIFTLNLIWVYYNYYMIFKRVGERRKKVLKCSDKDLLQFFNIDQKLLEKARKYHRMEVILKNKEIIIADSSIPDL